MSVTALVEGICKARSAGWLHPGTVRRIGSTLLALVLFNSAYWGLRLWGHGLWALYLTLACVVWRRYPTGRVRGRLAVLLALQFCFEALPGWIPASYGGGDGGYTASLFLYWPLSLRPFFMATDHPWNPAAVYYTVWAVIAALALLPLAAYFRGRRFYCAALCRWALISETLGEPFRWRAPKGAWAERLQWSGAILFFLVAALTALRAFHLDTQIGSRALSQWYQLIFVNYLTFQAGIALVPLLGARAKCRYNCPMGAYLGFFQRLGRFRLVATASRCIRCSKCDDACDMGIPVMSFAAEGGLLSSPRCTGCGLCVSVCPTDVLSFGYFSQSSQTQKVHA